MRRIQRSDLMDTDPPRSGAAVAGDSPAKGG
jgi:hypothetical protein